MKKKKIHTEIYFKQQSLSHAHLGENPFPDHFVVLYVMSSLF